MPGQEKKLDDRYVWHDFIYNLMSSLNNKEEDVYNMNYISALNWLSYFKNKSEIDK